MWKHLQSATKLVLLMFSLNLCIIVTVIVLKNLDNEKITLPLVILFGNIIVAVFSYYFGKGQSNPGSVTVTPGAASGSTSTVTTSSQTTTPNDTPANVSTETPNL